MKVKLWG